MRGLRIITWPFRVLFRVMAYTPLVFRFLWPLALAGAVMWLIAEVVEYDRDGLVLTLSVGPLLFLAVAFMIERRAFGHWWWTIR